jgi:hypothetical protein
LKVIALSIASWLGIDFLEKQPEVFYGEIEPGDGPSIDELNAAIKSPLTWGGETLQASLEVMRLLRPEGSS